MRRAATCLTALLLLTAVPAAACTPPPGWPENVKLDVPRIAKALAHDAVTIDVAVAERATGDYEVGTTPQANAEAMANYTIVRRGRKPTAAQVSAWLKRDEVVDGARLHYRVIERLKGSSRDVFTLNGVVYGPGKPGPRRLDSTAQLRARLNSRDWADWQGFGACIQPLWTELGHRYIVFRDAHGRLLRRSVPILLLGKPHQIQGPVYAEINAAGDDAWLKAVRAAVAADH